MTLSGYPAELPRMNYGALKEMEGQRVNLWPRPRVEPGGWEAQMQWVVDRVDRTSGVVELLAPSGHVKNVADVIHHYESAGNYLVLDAQLVIKGHAVDVEPRPWGVGLAKFRRHQRTLARRRARLRQHRMQAQQRETFVRNLDQLNRTLQWCLDYMNRSRS